MWGVGTSKRSLVTAMPMQETGAGSAFTIRNVDRPWLSTKQPVEYARCFTLAAHNNKSKNEYNNTSTQLANG